MNHMTSLSGIPDSLKRLPWRAASPQGLRKRRNEVIKVRSGFT